MKAAKLLVFVVVLLCLYAGPAWAQTTTLNVTKVDGQADNTVTVGENLTYTVFVQNTGTQPATAVQLADPVPANTTFVSAQVVAGDPRDDCTEPPPGATSGSVTCNLGTIDPGEQEAVQITVRPTAAAGQAGSVTNIATADGSNTAPDSDTESTQVQALEITVEKDDQPDAVDVGEALIYTIEVTNNTGEDNLNLFLEDQLPDEVDFIDLEPESSCEETSGVVTCEIDDLDDNETFTLQIAVEPQEDGIIQNTAQVFCDAPATSASCPSANPDPFTPSPKPPNLPS